MTHILAAKKKTYQEFEAQLEAAQKWLQSQPEFPLWQEHLKTFEEQHPYEEIAIETTEEIDCIVKPTYGGIVAGPTATAKKK